MKLGDGVVVSRRNLCYVLLFSERSYMKRIGISLSNINRKMFFALLLMGLCPAIYTTVRTFLIGQLPGDYAFSIAGQLSWVNLFYEVLSEAIVLPLYFFMGRALHDKKEFENRARTGLLTAFIIYVICSALTMCFIHPLLRFMAVDATIIPESATYIQIECVANVFGILYSFITVVLITVGKEKSVYVLTGAKVLLSIVLDVFMVSTLSVSLDLGINGIGYSNIIANIVLLSVAAVLLRRSGYRIFKKEKMSFGWMREFAKVGGISGLESFVRNFAYIMMVSRMVNMVSEQGTYWVANNFIWGWMLLPILQLGELIKHEISRDEKAIRNNSLGYFAITGIVVLLWVVLIPAYKPFMTYALGYGDVDKLFGLVMLLFGFYILFAIQNVFDMTFYGCGKTSYMLLESVVTNSVYYGIFFVLYLTGVWVPSLTSIALMFGAGNAFDAVVSGIVYAYMLKKKKINIWKVEKAISAV